MSIHLSEHQMDVLMGMQRDAEEKLGCAQLITQLTTLVQGEGCERECARLLGDMQSLRPDDPRDPMDTAAMEEYRRKTREYAAKVSELQDVDIEPPDHPVNVGRK